MVWFLDLAMSAPGPSDIARGTGRETEFIFVYSLRKCCNTLSFTCPSFSALLIEETIFSTLYSCFLCHELIDHRCVGLFLGSLSALLIYMSILCQEPHF